MSTQPNHNRFGFMHFLLFIVNTITFSSLQHTLKILSMKLWILDVVITFAIPNSSSTNQSRSSTRITDVVVFVNKNFKSKGEEGEGEAKVEVSIEGRVNDTVGSGDTGLDEDGGVRLCSVGEGEEEGLNF